jgi:putative transposase
MGIASLHPSYTLQTSRRHDRISSQFPRRGQLLLHPVNLAERRLRLLTDHITALRAALRDVRRRHPFEMNAIVVLPDHLHAVWTLPQDDADFAVRWRMIKSAFSRSLPPGERISGSRAAKGERGIRQRRYWEHTIRDERDFARHIDYIHINPVKHGYVSRVVTGSGVIRRSARSPATVLANHFVNFAIPSHKRGVSRSSRT